ncbi:MAG: class I tRNA ligase family protein, partial [Patescibacteria group bacterium]
MKKKFYITTSIAYANAAPHLGHALEFINADAIARYRRQCGDSVLFSTGTDEHGVKIVRRAEELNTTPQKLVDENSEKFRALKKDLNLSWDVFIRTSDHERHWPVAEAIWDILYKNGDLYRKAYEGLYCVGHEAFITEKDMRGGVCDIHKKPPETLREENWFFRLSKYQKKIEKALAGNPRTQRAEQSSYDGNPQTWKAEQSSYDGNPQTWKAEQS